MPTHTTTYRHDALRCLTDGGRRGAAEEPLRLLFLHFYPKNVR